jgi:hypothetical protein
VLTDPALRAKVVQGAAPSKLKAIDPLGAPATEAVHVTTLPTLAGFGSHSTKTDGVVALVVGQSVEVAWNDVVEPDTVNPEIDADF